MLKIN